MSVTLTNERQCQDVKNYKYRLNLIGRRMLYSCTHMATVGVKGLRTYTTEFSGPTALHCRPRLVTARRDRHVG